MGKTNKHLAQMTIRTSLMWTFLIAVTSICLLSMLAILITNHIQQEIWDQRGYVINAEVLQPEGTPGIFHGTISDNSIQRLPFTTRQRAAYLACTIAMVALPMVFIVLGILLTSTWYYRAKLRMPILQLQRGIRKIQQNDLDFSLDYPGKDELSGLCASMETMRTQLRQNAKRAGELLEQRKLLNASIAHDLRTPITILQGYLAYLDKSQRQGCLSQTSLTETLGDMRKVTQRLERYVDCVRDIQKLENIPVKLQPQNTTALLQELERNIQQLNKTKEICFQSFLADQQITTDPQLLFRLAENLLQNALRYAQRTIVVHIREEGDFLILRVEDDGIGFPAEVLNQAPVLPYLTGQDGMHRGMGLGICNILCEKLGGSLLLGNRPEGGACIWAKIKK